MALIRIAVAGSVRTGSHRESGWFVDGVVNQPLGSFDRLIVDSNQLLVDEAALTGETYPAEKTPGVVPADAPIASRTNSVFMGTHVTSGSGSALIVLVLRPRR